MVNLKIMREIVLFLARDRGLLYYEVKVLDC